MSSPDLYDVKCIYSYSEIELYEYERPVMSHPPKFSIKKRIKKLKQGDKVKFSLNRTKHAIRRMCNCNTQLNKFITLTFADHIDNLTDANRLFSQFIKRLLRK